MSGIPNLLSPVSYIFKRFFSFKFGGLINTKNGNNLNNLRDSLNPNSVNCYLKLRLKVYL